MLSAETFASLGLQINFQEITSFPNHVNPRIIYKSDWEGPFRLGDPMAALMKKKVQGGEALYNDTYDCFNEHRRNGRYHPTLAQEAHDTIFALGACLVAGLTNRYLIQEAHATRPMPGAQDVVDSVRSNGGFVVGITTAPTFMYEQMAKEIGLARLIGSPFPLEEVRALLESMGRMEEIELFRKFIKEYCALKKATEQPLAEALHSKITEFLEGELGISFDPQVRLSRNGNGHQTVLGQVMENEAMIGNHNKLKVSRLISQNNALSDTVEIAIGDGVNDMEMLQDAGNNPLHIGIAINGKEAATAAQIGVITSNIAIPMVPVIETKLKHPDIPNDRLIREVNEIISRNPSSEETHIHLAGPHTTTAELEQHAKVKRELKKTRF